MPKNAFYAQSGGVTSVINASAAGVIETARQHTDQIGKVYAGRNGIIGALTEDLIDTTFALGHQPGHLLAGQPAHLAEVAYQQAALAALEPGVAKPAQGIGHPGVDGGALGH